MQEEIDSDIVSSESENLLNDTDQTEIGVIFKNSTGLKEDMLFTDSGKKSQKLYKSPRKGHATFGK